MKLLWSRVRESQFFDLCLCALVQDCPTYPSPRDRERGRDEADGVKRETTDHNLDANIFGGGSSFVSLLR
jgi:hypothetical protein